MSRTRIKLDIGLTLLGNTVALRRGTKVEIANRRGRVLVTMVDTGRKPITRRPK